MTDDIREATTTGSLRVRSPWPGLWAVVVGFFMILVDTTIVSVANPAIKAALDPDSTNLDNVVWVTSAYLLAYAVPLLITGRLGDRFGPKNMYLLGLGIFTAASLWCGFAQSLEMLVAARAVQGLGAALITPQTMAIITRTFPPHRRGAAMGLWGATAGVATLVGPLAGGLLVDGLGWEWIFFVNIPVGIVGFILAVILVPKLETHPHRFDLVGVVLSAVALFLIVFGLQEGEKFAWGPIWGPVTVWQIILVGVVVLAVFIWTQAKTRSEPLVPLGLFRDRNFSAATIGITTVGFSMTTMALPIMFYLQLARGLTPTESALLMVPMAVLSGILAPYGGRLLDRIDPRFLLVPGLALAAASLVLYSFLMRVDIPVAWLLLPSATLGVATIGMWGPLATTATRGLDLRQAGAGAGVYNGTRTVGAVLGSAAIAAFMQARLVSNVPQASGAANEFATSSLPAAVAGPFGLAMAQTLLLPAAALLIGVVAVLFIRHRPPGRH